MIRTGELSYKCLECNACMLFIFLETMVTGAYSSSKLYLLRKQIRLSVWFFSSYRNHHTLGGLVNLLETHPQRLLALLQVACKTCPNSIRDSCCCSHVQTPPLSTYSHNREYMCVLSWRSRFRFWVQYTVIHRVWAHQYACNSSKVRVYEMATLWRATCESG